MKMPDKRDARMLCGIVRELEVGYEEKLVRRDVSCMMPGMICTPAPISCHALV